MIGVVPSENGTYYISNGQYHLFINHNLPDCGIESYEITSFRI